MIRFFLCICKSVVENHYNLLYREDERELIPIMQYHIGTHKEIYN